MAETVYILNQTAPANYRDISAQDAALSTEISIPAEFRATEHFIQFHIYSPDGSRLLSVPDYRRSKELNDSASAGKKGTDALYIDPIADSIAYGFPNGNVTLNYNFLNSLLSSSFTIKEVSADRTEIKAIPTQENFDLLEEVSNLRTRLQQDVYFNELRLDFGNNNQFIGVNLDISEDGALLLKLYENLPNSVGIKSVFNVVEEIADPIAYNVQSTFIPDAPRQNYLKGPNFNIDVEQSPSVSTEYLDYNELYSYPVTSSYHQTLTLLSGSGIRINVDYSDYSNFVHFSSAYERLANFKYKLDLIHTYEASKAATGSLSNAQTAVTQSNLRYDNLIKGVVSKFDEYEKYLYFESGSKSWPKSTATKPYLNSPSSNGIATSWFNAQLTTASLYDELNESRLSNSIPEFIRQDSSNAPFTLFLDMVSQHFDNLWLYAKGITDKYDADNRISYGISRDLIEDTLRSFGVKLYNSNFSTANLASMLIGEWYDSGSEQINSFITASNQPTPDSDILHETYKRVYHNLPHLLKTKGTERGLRALINTFGIPSGSLEIKTFGGVRRPGETPYFASSYSTGSKLRLDNTGSIVPGETLSQYITIQKDDSKFTQDQHVIEAGFSPSYNIDNYILSTITSSFNIDQYIGDPRYLYTDGYTSDTNGNLEKVAETLLSGSNAYDVFDFIRLIKFFDNQLFKMIKDFVPARDVITSGIIIKPHILDRSKIKSTQASYTRPEHTSSIDTLFVTGSDGGVIDTYSTAYTASIQGLLGTVTQIQNTEVEKYNGELEGTVLDLYNGSLNEANTLKTAPNIVLYYNTSGSNGNSPSAGEIFWRYSQVGSTPTTGYYGVTSMHINVLDRNNVSIRTALHNLTPGDKITFTIRHDGIEGGSPCGSPQNTTITQTIFSIAPTSQPSIWKIQFLNSSVYPLYYLNTGFCDGGVTYLNYTDSSVFLNPFVTADNFFNSDYNALMNNATSIANAANVQKVDYSTNPLIPVNIEAIRANNAQKAEIQEYVYNSAGLVRGKYKGKQLTGAVLNKFTTGDTSYGKAPVAESTTPYFCIFDYISGFSPEHNQANAVVISYIVDEEGNLTTPDSSVALNLLKQSFPSSTEFDVSIQGSSTGGTEAALLGTHTVLRSGTRIEPIVFSYTAATYLNPVYNAASKLEFEADPTLQTYEARATGSNQSITNTTIGARTQITFGKELNDDAGNYNPGTSKYIFGSDTEQQVKFTGNFTVVGDGWPNPYGGDPGLATIKIEHTTDGGTFDPAYTTVIGSKTFSYINYIPVTVNVTSPYRDFASGEAVRVMVEIEDRTADLTFNQSIFNAISAESGSTYVDWGSEGYFFTTGSSQTPTVLTASIALSDKYEKYFAGISASGAQGFNEVTLPFTLQRGDEFKFDNSEKKSYMITAVETPSENTVGRLYVTLDKQMSKAANKDFFAVRRYVDASNMILMSVLKVGGTQNTGILYPKYPSLRLKQNYEKIISDLKTKGIL